MTHPPPSPSIADESTAGFTAEQKEYLEGFLSGVARLHVASGEVRASQDNTSGPPSPPAPAAEETIHGFPLSEVTKQERWKHEENPLDCWDRLLQHAQLNKAPNEEDTFRFRYHGLFHVAPAQDAFMLRCRIPAGELQASQLRGLADIAEEYGNARAAITTRSNIQIREIAPANIVHVVTRLQSLGLTARGSGVDNVRNITASPTAGFDPRELIDTRPYAHALHHYILNHRDLYGLPRKFNVAFEGGGAIDTVAETNDIGFMAVQLRPPPSAGNTALHQGSTVKDGSAISMEPGVYFRVALCGITGHKQLAHDSGLMIPPGEAVAVTAAMIRVFTEHGDRTNRKKARLKYLVDQWGTDKFLAETQRKLAFPLVRFPLASCESRSPAVRQGHIGVYRQKQRGLNYIGAVIPVGIMTSRQMRRLADLAIHHGSGQVRLTPWQNMILPDVTDAYVETVKRGLVRMGFHHEASHYFGGLVACTGNTGCKWAATDTKGQAVALARHLQQRVPLDQPVNIHLTGCPHSCAQHYVGDIGLQGVKVNVNGESVEGYNIVLGGGTGADPVIAREVFKGISFAELPALLERVLKVYQSNRCQQESFAAFTRRHDIGQLQELFSE
jgi:ferredoxin-nitrite reductase